MDSSVDAGEFSIIYDTEERRVAKKVGNVVFLTSEYLSVGYTWNYPITSDSYEDIKRLIILAGVFFLVAVLFIYMKRQISVDEIFKWSPVVWLVGVLLCCVIMNVLCYCRRIYKKRQLRRFRRQEEILLSLNLATSFPCLAPPPHDPQCCGGSGYLWSSIRHDSVSSLPSYNQVISSSSHSMAHDGGTKGEVSVLSGASVSDIDSSSLEAAPPNYDEAVRMLNH